MVPVKDLNKPELIGQLIDTVEDFLTPRVRRFAAEDDEPVIAGDDYDKLSSNFEALLKNWNLLQDPEMTDMDFYIGADSVSGVYTKSKAEFLSYLSDMIDEAAERGDAHFDVSIMDLLEFPQNAEG